MDEAPNTSCPWYPTQDRCVPTFSPPQWIGSG
uniref:Uncharacterized protein n=1 Tax=Arundo donax TaxID=35708 RepID=A0A0A9EF69_ARUDO